MLADSGLQYQDSLCTDCIRSTRCRESSSLPDTSSRSLQKTAKNPLWCTEKKLWERKASGDRAHLFSDISAKPRNTHVLYHLAKQNSTVSQKYQPVLKILIAQPLIQLWKVNSEVLHPVHQNHRAELHLHPAHSHSGLEKRLQVSFVSCTLPTMGTLPHATLCLNKTWTLRSKSELNHAKESLPSVLSRRQLPR